MDNMIEHINDPKTPIDEELSLDNPIPNAHDPSFGKSSQEHYEKNRLIIKQEVSSWQKTMNKNG